VKRLNLGRAPRWVEIDAELKVLARPLGRIACMEILAPLREVRGEALGAEPDLDDAEALLAALPVLVRQERLMLAVVQAAVAAAVAEWTVVGEDGARLPPAPEVVEALIEAEPQLAGALLHALVLGPLTAQAAEKNGFAPSPPGTSAGAETTAGPAPAPAQTVPPN